MSEPEVVLEFAVQLMTDGSIRYFGLTDYRQPMSETDEHARAVETVQAAMPGAEVVKPSDPWETAPTLEDLIKAAKDADVLAALWREHKDEWTAEHNKLAAQRKKELGK